MTLISMLIALIIERLAVRTKAWQWVSYVQPYLQVSRQGPLANLINHQFGIVLWWLLPSLVVAVVLFTIDFWLVNLLVNTLVLLLCIGCWHYRQLYKQYLNAAERQDQEAAYLVMMQINAHAGIASDELSHGQRLIWINFKYYAAVLFWFALFGAFGAIAYAMLRQLAEPVTYLDLTAKKAPMAKDKAPQDDVQATSMEVVDDTVADAAFEVTAAENSTDSSSSEIFSETSQQTEAQSQSETNTFSENNAQPEESIDVNGRLEQQHRVQGFASDLSHWADWLPVRLFGLGFALVGHFSKASAALIAYLVDSSTPAEIVLADIAKAAEPLPDELRNCNSEVCSLVQLSKRNILFFLALVAVLTLSGLIS
ncbi:MAG: regulatory signaling modulator protein AmpE [Gammaproteobacteria bacterium]|jgi:AmpE protein|nr:regulatory signaling modulator protein AmpE [Gammaproteobacteria bacterium]MBU2180139.1 regulatory signaling modulator protein AmpE [Gammaproteobacteria bacterium]MBU2223004.1 regulatory signaling modulator protein AmpE [Gammaproteobacteria bacterium]MBU2279887.1 regulatory signaling modulator protein AmpE [Gammaproteobacteria bacterium]MBU2426970.1 regulatory signaling modulator protein AmpE [Gammaproteobacteria bacterium]